MDIEKLNELKTLIIELLSAYETNYGEMCGLFRELEIEMLENIREDENDEN